MEKTTHINDFTTSLPKMLQAWKVVYKGKDCGTVKATSYRQAYKYLPSGRFPDKNDLTLEYVGISK
jgi:hypothetical protein